MIGWSRDCFPMVLHNILGLTLTLICCWGCFQPLRGNFVSKFGHNFFRVTANGMIFTDKSYFDTYFRKMLWKFSKTQQYTVGKFTTLSLCSWLKTATTLNCCKNVSDKYFFQFFLHISINQPQSWSKLLNFLKKKSGF